MFYFLPPPPERELPPEERDPPPEERELLPTDRELPEDLDGEEYDLELEGVE